MRQRLSGERRGDAVERLQPWFRAAYVVILANGRKVNTTRAYRAALKDLIDRP